MKMRKILMLTVLGALAWAGLALAQSATDNFSMARPGLVSPAEHAFSITPNDSADLSYATRAIYVGSGGDIVVTTAGGETVTFKGALGGTFLNVRVTRVKATGTTATDLVGLY